MKNKHQKPMHPLAFHILTALRDKEMDHGYSLMVFVQDKLRYQVSTPSFYRQLIRMEDDGLIEEATAPKSNDDPRRRYFRITRDGMDQFLTERDRWGDVYVAAGGNIRTA